MVVMNSIKAVIFYFMVVVGICYNLLFVLTPAVPFIFLNRRFYFRWCSFALGHYLLMITCLLEDLLGIKIVVTGDDLTKDKNRSIILLNHRTRLDWLYIWTVHSRFQMLNQLKIVMKAQLKHIPGIGWACQHAGYLFLQREWEKDQQRINNIIGYYKSCQSPLSLLIFPEGTNLTNETKIRSNNYASKKQIIYNRPYDYCLHPHITGFTYLLNTMRSNEIIDAVDDVTIGYEGNFPMSELDLLKGHFPKVVHFHIKRYRINDLPKDDEQIGQWLQKCWDDKENRLKEFYIHNQFDSSSTRFNNEQTESNVRFQRRLALILWIICILFWSYCLIAFIKIKLYVLLVCIFHLVMEVYANGLIDFVCQLDANYRRNRSAIKQD